MLLDRLFFTFLFLYALSFEMKLLVIYQQLTHSMSSNILSIARLDSLEIWCLHLKDYLNQWKVRVLLKEYS